MEPLEYYSWDSPAEDFLANLDRKTNISTTEQTCIKILQKYVETHSIDTVLDLFGAWENVAAHETDQVSKRLCEQYFRHIAVLIVTHMVNSDKSWLMTWKKTVRNLVDYHPLFPKNLHLSEKMKTRVTLLQTTISDVENSGLFQIQVDLHQAPPIFRLLFDSYRKILRHYDVVEFLNIAKEEWKWDNNTPIVYFIQSPILTYRGSAEEFKFIVQEISTHGSTIGSFEKVMKENVDFRNWIYTNFDQGRIEAFFRVFGSGPIDETCLDKQHNYISIGGAHSPLKDTKEHYREDCVNAVRRGNSPNDLNGDNKYKRVSIISGPSGSGKTFCAINYVPKIEQKKENKETRDKLLFVVYMEGKTMGSAANEQRDRFNLKDFISSTVVNALNERLQANGQNKMTGPLKHIYLALIIDEVNCVKDILKDEEALGEVEDVLLNQISESGHLIVCGTGYETVSGDILTASGAQKYDMLPWHTEHFEAKAKEVAGKSSTWICSVVKQSPLLMQLTTNGRTCQFLIASIMTTSWYHEAKTIPKTLPSYLKKGTDGYDCAIHDLKMWLEPGLPPSGISFLLASVAMNYTASNGLSNCTKTEKRLIAQSVLDELHLATRAARDPKQQPPQFQKLKDLRDRLKNDREQTEKMFGMYYGHEAKLVYRFKVLEAQALSLMKYNLEKDADKNYNVYSNDGRPSVEVSPAITLVLCYMLGVSADILVGWEGLEAVTAIHAFFTAVRETKPEDIWKWKIAELPSPLPATTGWTHIGTLCEFATCEVPVDICNTVFVNGPMAPYADIIAPGKLIQAKYTSRKSIDIDLVAETGKVGVLNDKAAQRAELLPIDKDSKKTVAQKLDAFRRTRTVGRAVTSYFYSKWESATESGAAGLTSDPGAAKIPSPEGEAEQQYMSEQAVNEATTKADTAIEKVNENIINVAQLQAAQQHQPSAASAPLQSAEDSLKAAFEIAVEAINEWATVCPSSAAKLQAENAFAKAQFNTSDRQRTAVVATGVPVVTQDCAYHMHPASQLLHTPKTPVMKMKMKKLKVPSLNFPVNWKKTIIGYISHQRNNGKGEHKVMASSKFLRIRNFQYRTSLLSANSDFNNDYGYIERSAAIPLKATFNEKGKSIDFVLVTNAKQLVLKFATKAEIDKKQADGTESAPKKPKNEDYCIHNVIITRDDVNHEGELKQIVAIDKFRTDFMEKGVKLRFLFC
eukprot:CAMPEP_0119571866 /NCGR_PEP_ID=MMETSP1352-20130426/44335_1 /TAXON_ID=265584 /ORGANISM="Stauroneis constricta, Strain CCMP1120" /LENGTH=1198 /DNA_ID=CAMNT_0007621549 /DNA_START=41 /DNA_END=3637 /DNA_ORIENTATION=-